MRNLLLGAVATTSLLCASLSCGGAQAAPQGGLMSGVYRSGDAASLQPAQFIFSGQNYCWYATGWQGPGFYWCGYAWRRGLGWGGGNGWHGWHGGGGSGARNYSGGGARTGHAHAGGARSAAVSRGGHAGGGHAGGGHGGGGAHAVGGHAGGGGGGHKRG